MGGTVGSDFPPKLPLRGVGGHIQGTVVGSLNKVSLVGLVELNKDSLQESKAKQSPCNRSGSFVTSCLVYFLPRRAVPKPGERKEHESKRHCHSVIGSLPLVNVKETRSISIQHMRNPQG